MPGWAVEAGRIGDNLANNADPPGSGGLLAALHLLAPAAGARAPNVSATCNTWAPIPLVTSQELLDRRAIMLLGQDSGTPVAHAPDLCDALMGTYGGVSCRFIYDAKTGNLAALEMHRSPDR